MQSPEEFMRELLLANVAEVAEDAESYRLFHQKFYAADCLWDSRKGAVKLAKSETVESICNLNGKVLVVTRLAGPTDFFGSFRYHLRPNGESWLIQSVDWACSRCRRLGSDSDCNFCGGSGWSDLTRTEPNESMWENFKRTPPTRSNKRFEP